VWIKFSERGKIGKNGLTVKESEDGKQREWKDMARDQ
jgi:hypothetical protein